MNIWEVDKLIIFIAFVIPGFISIKVYDLFVPTERREVGKYLIDAIAYSCINYALVFWILILAEKNDLYNNHSFLFFILIVAVLFIFPTIWALVFIKLRKLKFFLKRIPHPISKPWDYVFGKREVYWVIIYLTDGTKFGGMYDTQSFASSYPEEEQIYIQKVWEIGENNKFLAPINRSKGVLVSKKDIKAVEFFK